MKILLLSKSPLIDRIPTPPDTGEADRRRGEPIYGGVEREEAARSEGGG
jgi:hypothetical protein